jgi:hypothetical protein
MMILARIVSFLKLETLRSFFIMHRKSRWVHTDAKTLPNVTLLLRLKGEPFQKAVQIFVSSIMSAIFFILNKGWF